MLRPLAILCILRDPLPPRRPDVCTLFGVALPRYGIRTALIGQADAHAKLAWPGGTLHRAGRFNGAASSLLAPCFDSLRLLCAAVAARPDVLQVRDKIVVALLARLVAALLHIPFVYWMSFPIVEGYAVHAATVRLALLHRLRAWSTHWLLYRLVLPGAALVFVQSAAMANALADRGVNRARLASVPMGGSGQRRQSRRHRQPGSYLPVDGSSRWHPCRRSRRYARYRG